MRWWSVDQQFAMFGEAMKIAGGHDMPAWERKSLPNRARFMEFALRKGRSPKLKHNEVAPPARGLYLDAGRREIGKEPLMGCDIHIILERKDTERCRWVGLRQLGHLPSKALGLVPESKLPWVTWRIKNRDYAFFAALAQVRGEDDQGYEARGFPEDMSELSQYVLGDDDDLHSASWLTAKELAPPLLRVKEGVTTSTRVHDKLLGVDEEEFTVLHRWIDDDITPENIDEWRIVFAFDN